jgi:hypothetical protein
MELISGSLLLGESISDSGGTFCCPVPRRSRLNFWGAVLRRGDSMSGSVLLEGSIFESASSASESYIRLVRRFLTAGAVVAKICALFGLVWVLVVVELSACSRRRLRVILNPSRGIVP